MGQSRQGDYVRLIQLIGPHAWVLALGVLAMVISSAFESVSIGAIIPFVDKILAGGTIALPASARVPGWVTGLVTQLNALSRQDLLGSMVVFLMVSFLLRGCFMFVQSYLMNRVGQQVVKDIKDRLYGHLLTLSQAFYSRAKVGELASRITFDTQMVQSAIAECFAEFIYQSFLIVIYLATMVGITVVFSIPWLLVVMSVAVLPSLVYPVTRIGRYVRRMSQRVQERMGDINSRLYETLAAIRIVQAFCMEAHELQKFQGETQRFYRAMMKSIKRTVAIGPLTEFVAVACSALIIWFGGAEVIAGRLSPGAFIAFLTSILLIIRPFKRLAKIHTVNQQAMAAVPRIMGLLDVTPTVAEVPLAPALPVFHDRIVFDEVWFQYGSREVLRGISLEVRVGEVVALVGPSGVGKTTLVNLLPRFYDPQRGRLLIDGYDLRSVTLHSLRRQIGIVTQETVLFDDTVANNIAYGCVGASRTAVERAARIAHADGFIRRMPEGYETVIGERGVALSGGERQRLAIARAILRDPPILIFDEATSQLDSESERLIQEALDYLLEGGRTVFVIAHRLATIRRASRIVVLNGGVVADSGSHEDLMTRGGLYQRLYQMQVQAS